MIQLKYRRSELVEYSTILVLFAFNLFLSFVSSVFKHVRFLFNYLNIFVNVCHQFIRMILPNQDDFITDEFKNINNNYQQNKRSKKNRNRIFPENVDPESLINFQPTFLVYRTMKIKSVTKFSYQMSLDEDDLFYAKCSKHQNKPIHIYEGSKPIKDSKVDYILTPSLNLKHFSLTQNHHEISTVDIVFFEPKRRSPFIVSANWFAKKQQNYHFKTRQPELQSDGSYVLDFEGRFADPSPINSIFEDCNTDEIMIMIRKLDKWEMNSDVLPEIPPLFVFVLIMVLNLYPF